MKRMKKCKKNLQRKQTRLETRKEERFSHLNKKHKKISFSKSICILEISIVLINRKKFG